MPAAKVRHNLFQGYGFNFAACKFLVSPLALRQPSRFYIVARRHWLRPLVEFGNQMLQHSLLILGAQGVDIFFDVLYRSRHYQFLFTHA